jgi:predicted nucleotidyltransferase
MLSLQQVKNSLTSVKPYLQQKYNISTMSIFGSYAREEQTNQSDIDILVEFQKTPDLLTFIEIEEFLNKKLKSVVDLVPQRKLKSQLKSQILKEAISI